MLLDEFDKETNAVLNPDMVTERIENFPEVTISCFSRKLFNNVLETFDAKKITEIHSSVDLNPVYEVEYKGKSFALFQSFVGEPLCVAQYEDLMAIGSKRLILLGNCGVLDKTIEDCGIIIPTAALRDEGTSFHYAEPSDVIEPQQPSRRCQEEAGQREGRNTHARVRCEAIHVHGMLRFLGSASVKAVHIIPHNCYSI